eukprot:TRINITY_DN66279_c0_g1_i1.p3 TRINITY_DN66279_c0_g1~~TRINITY_DN66279_c0_g1_i1.p3  ORF type:complete len:117 (+),score=28.78 TRINITY_DN66279_c0_g1_i1:54-404(+)
MVQRVHFAPKHKYKTGGHDGRFVIGHIPGGKLVAKRLKKRVAGPHTPKYLGHQRLQGTRAMREMGKYGSYKAPTRQKSVSRAYGGVLSHRHVRERVIRAFLIEEMKIVKRVLRKTR